MEFQSLTPVLSQLDLGPVNCFLLQTRSGLCLVDTGLPDHGPQIHQALAGRKLSGILLTHVHPDHAGGAAYLHQQTGAPVWIHAQDARLLREGKCLRSLTPAPGRLSRFLFDKFVRGGLEEIPPCTAVEEFPAQELVVLESPGHSAGHVCFLWPQEGVLVAGDVAANVGWLRPSPGYEDYSLGLESLKRLASYPFETAVFGHGKPIMKGASRKFRSRFEAPPTFRHALRIEVSAEALWELTMDVASWPEFVPTVTAVELRRPGALEVGSQVVLRQPGLAPAPWEVTELEPPYRFQWVSRQGPLRMTATHRIEESGSGCVNHLELTLSGVAARPAARLLAAKFHSALAAENSGFQKRSCID